MYINKEQKYVAVRRICDTCAYCVTSWVGWGGVGDVDVPESLQHTRMPRLFWFWVGCMGCRDVDVRENLQHTRMLRLFLGWVGWGGGC